VAALFGQGRRGEVDKAFEQAKAMQPPPQLWMVASTTEQLKKLETMLMVA
jgi:hypothetical protein